MALSATLLRSARASLVLGIVTIGCLIAISGCGPTPTTNPSEDLGTQTGQQSAPSGASTRVSSEAPRSTRGFASGAVYGSSGEPLAEVRVIAYSEEGDRFHYVADFDTLEDGEFRLQLPEGDYRLGFFDLGNQHRTEYYPNADSIEGAGVVNLADATDLFVALEPRARARAQMWIESMEPVTPVTRLPFGLSPSLAIAAVAREETEGEDCPVLQVDDLGVTKVHPCEWPLPMNAMIHISYVMACKNPSSVYLETGGFPAATTKVSLCKSPANDCQQVAPKQQADGTTLYHWGIPLNQLREGPLVIKWTCKSNPFHEALIGQLDINDPSGRVTMNGIRRPGVPVRLYSAGALPGHCDGSTKTPPHTAGSFWAPRWSGFNPMGAGGTFLANQVTDDFGYYGWTVSDGICYYVEVDVPANEGAACSGGSAQPSPVIGFESAAPIVGLHFTCP